MRRSLTVALLLAASTAAAQSDPASRFMDNCRNNRWNDDERFCETRSFTVAAGKLLTVDGRTNGGITVHGWDRSDIQVIAMIQGQADDRSTAQNLVKGVNILTNGSEIRADGPSTGRHESWSVSYDIYVPRRTELALSANNGGISVESMALTLKDVHGDVHGRTVNGGVTAELTGDRWLGAGLDLRTTNGGVHLIIPQSYSANLETGTVNGSINVDFPVTVQGRLGRQFSTTLGGGGATIRATTSNGGVSIRRR
jgi:DUF4097 and DUF4098 domain-containing protein YvlB